MTPPRVAARGWVLAEGFAGRRGRRPLRVAREWAAAGACPSSGPAGPPSPTGEGKGCSGGIHPSRGVGGSGRSRRGGGTPPYGWGYGNTVGLTRAAVPGPPCGRGRACPARGGLRRQASMVRSVGRGLDPSAGGYPGDGCWREVSRGVGDAALYGLPGEGRQREPTPHPALRGHLPPRGKARAVWRQRDAAPYPGSWSSVRSWRVRL